MKSIFTLAIFSVFLFTSCSEEKSDDTGSTDTSCGTYTYDGEAKNIIDTQCGACHTNSQSPNLTNYAEVKAQIDRIKARAIDQKTMPPSGTGSLSAAQLEILECWIEDNSPE